MPSIENSASPSSCAVLTPRIKELSVLDPSVFVLPAESENFDESTLITQSVVLSAVGVNVAV